MAKKIFKVRMPNGLMHSYEIELLNEQSFQQLLRMIKTLNSFTFSKTQQEMIFNLGSENFDKDEEVKINIKLTN